MDLLILDDFGLKPLDGNQRLMLLEIFEDRHGRKSTIVTSQGCFLAQSSNLTKCSCLSSYITNSSGCSSYINLANKFDLNSNVFVMSLKLLDSKEIDLDINLANILDINSGRELEMTLTAYGK